MPPPISDRLAWIERLAYWTPVLSDREVEVLARACMGYAYRHLQEAGIVPRDEPSELPVMPARPGEPN